MSRLNLYIDLNEEEMQALNDQSIEAGQTLTDYVRQRLTGVVRPTPPAPAPEPEPKLEAETKLAAGPTENK